MSPTGSSGHSSGMTLLELLVVLVIASLMLALVAPNIGNALPGSELKGFARQSAALIRELRSEAVGRSRVLRLQADAEQRVFISGPVGGEAGGDVSSEPGGDTEVRARWPEGIEVRMNEKTQIGQWRDPFNDQPMLLFYPDGSSSGGELLLSRSQDSGDGYRVQIDSLSGEVRIDAGD